MASRRSLLRTLAGLSSAVGVGGCLDRFRSSPRETDLGLAANPASDRLPDRQHALNDALRADSDGNPLPPRFHTVLLADLDEPPSVETGRTIERAARTLEAAYEWAPDGLFHLLAWGPKYFSRIDALDRAPVRKPEVLSRTDRPELQNFDAALVLSADVPAHLVAAENAMFGSRDELNGVSVEARLGDVFELRGRRTGFIGEGLPVRHTDAEGIPSDAPLAEEAPMFMGFRSGFKNAQATEDRVTIGSGPLEGGTTMHLSHLEQSLDRWFDSFDLDERVARMFSPEFTSEDVAGFTDEVPFSDAVRDSAAEHGVVGHHEKVARAREDGAPLLLRRDFNTVDNGRAGVHFLSFQRSISDFEKTRKAMNGWYVKDESSSVGEQRNNGILEFITVVSRANFCVPPREQRSLPLF